MLHPTAFIALVLLSTATALAQHTWTQKVELQLSVERGSTGEPAQVTKSAIDDSVFTGGVVPQWIWGADNATNYVLRTSVDLKSVKAARLRASCDNVGTVYVNGKRVAGSSEWQEPMDADVTASLVDGSNVIEAEVENQGGAAAFVLKLAVLTSDGKLIEVVTDETWKVAAKRGEESTQAVEVRGTYGDGPWGNVFDNAAIASRVPAGVFELLPGFQVEKLFTVPKEELGSWVCITFDHKGRLLASDQGDKGIYRITLPTISEGETIVERLDFSTCEFRPTGAQGMLWAFDALYFSCNGGPGSGLYRARDTNNDDQFDECVRLKERTGTRRCDWRKPHREPG